MRSGFPGFRLGWSGGRRRGAAGVFERPDLLFDELQRRFNGRTVARMYRAFEIVPHSRTLQQQALEFPSPLPLLSTRWSVRYPPPRFSIFHLGFDGLALPTPCHARSIAQNGPDCHRVAVAGSRSRRLTKM
jgi:hypothetical protein